MKHQNATTLGLLASVLLGLQILQPAAAALATEIVEPRLAVDLDPGRDPDPLSPQGVTALGNRLYFTGENIEQGREPWVSDGTTAGTRLLADLCPGPCSSAAYFGKLGSKLVVVAQVGGAVRVLVEQGGELATVATLDGETGGLFQLGSQIFFSLYEPWRPGLPNGNTTLMVSDGTAAGTLRGKLLCSGSYCDADLSHLRVGDAVFFVTHNDAAGNELHRLLAGQQPQTIASFALDAGPFSWRALDGERIVFLKADPPQQERRVWIYEPGAGAHAIDPESPATTSLGGYFVTWRGRLYYRNALGESVTTNGTAGDLRPAAELTGPSPEVLAATPSSLFYISGDTVRAYRADGSQQVLLTGYFTVGIVASWGERVLVSHGSNDLWSSDGTSAGTVQLPSLWNANAAFDGAALGGGFYFAAGAIGAGTVNYGLWRTDGTAAGTAEVAAGSSTRPASSGARASVVGGKLIVDTTLAGNDRKLWRVDPETFAAEPLTSAAFVPLGNNGHVLLAQELATGQLYAVRDAGHPELLPASQVLVPSFPQIAVAPDGRFYFTDLSDGQELWESDGTAAGTRLLFDLDPSWIRPCSYGSCYIDFPAAITPAGHRVFFLASIEGSSSQGELWVYDRISGERSKVPLPAGNSIYLDYRSQLWAVGSRIVFASMSYPQQLWQSDGVHEATKFFEGVPRLVECVPVGDRLFFQLNEGSEQLWVSDLTPEGTFAVQNADMIRDLTRVGDHLFYRFPLGYESRLGWSDGTPAGTASMAMPGTGLWDLYPYSEHFSAAGDQRLVFAALTAEGGKAPFLSDGTAAGTRRLGDDGGLDLDPEYFARVGDRVFFQGDDTTTGRELWAVDLPAPSPGCPAGKLCLNQGRFEVSVLVRTQDGVRQGQRALATSESGVFTFFGPDNWEFLVKVLDGCAINDHFWVYAAAATDVAYTLEVRDRATGSTRTYGNPAGQAARPILDSSAFAGCAAEAPPQLYPPAAAPAPPAHRCADDLEELCLGGGRFRVAATWQTAAETGKAHAVANGSGDSGLFSFFAPANWELMVKVLDGCAINGKHWIFTAGTTDVGWTLEVEDLETGEVKVYRNSLGHPSIAVTDTAALGGCGS